MDIIVEILQNPTCLLEARQVGSEVSQYKILPTLLNLLQVTHISSEFLTNQEPVQLVQKYFSKFICLESFLYIGRNWQEVPDLNTIEDKVQVPD